MQEKMQEVKDEKKNIIKGSTISKKTFQGTV